MRNTEAPQADAAGEASSDERLRKHTFEQVVVVIVRPRRRHRQPVCAVGNKFQAGRRRPDESAERMRQAGAMRSGRRASAGMGGLAPNPTAANSTRLLAVLLRHLSTRLLFAARSLARGGVIYHAADSSLRAPRARVSRLDLKGCGSIYGFTPLATRYLLKGKDTF